MLNDDAMMVIVDLILHVVDFIFAHQLVIDGLLVAVKANGRLRVEVRMWVSRTSGVVLRLGLVEACILELSRPFVEGMRVGRR